MRVAIDTSPIDVNQQHNVRGSGFYVRHLKEALEHQSSDITFSYFAGTSTIPAGTDIVHYPYFDPFFLTLPFMRKYKTIVTVHDLIPLLFPKHFPVGINGILKWKIQKYSLSGANVIITDSEASKKDIVRILAFPADKVFVIPLAAADHFKKISFTGEEIKRIRKKYMLPETFLLYVGDVTWNKNLPRLINAVKKTEYPLIMVGKALAEKNFDESNPWNYDRKKVFDLTSNYPNIKKIGFISNEDLVAIYNLATVFVMPSLYEGFGLPVLEAMSCGTPVITTREGSLQEVAGKAAFYVDAYKEESIARGIEKVFTSSELQKDLSTKGFEQAAGFSWKKTAERTIQAYKSHISS